MPTEEEIQRATEYIIREMSTTHPILSECTEWRLMRDIKCMNETEIETFAYEYTSTINNWQKGFTKVHSDKWPATHKFLVGIQSHIGLIWRAFRNLTHIPYWV